jgi:dephospho-CoA kinase
MNTPIWAIIGGKGSGKDTVADYLTEKLHGHHFSCSAWLRKYGESLPEPKKMLWEVDLQLREERGVNYMVDIALEEAGGKPLIISGLRWLEPLDYVRELGGAIVEVDVDLETRHQRAIKRERPGEVIAPVWVENYVKPYGDHGAPTREMLKAKADVVIDNNGVLEDLFPQVDQLISARK